MNIFRRLRKIILSLSINPIFCRWVDACFLITCAIILLLAFAKPAAHLSNFVFQYMLYWPTPLVYSVVLLGSGVIAFALIRLGGLQEKFSASILLRYPSVWVIGIIGATIFCSVVLLFGNNSKSSWACYPAISFLPTIGTAFFGVLISLFYNALNNPNRTGMAIWAKHTHTHESEDLLVVAEDKKRFLAWLLDEKPINAPRDDMFGHKIHAQRIAALLLQNISSNIGILGPYGTGKSSLINLVKYYLSNKTEFQSQSIGPQYKGKVITCKVDGWGRVSGTVAHKILSISIEEVKKHVDCLAIATGLR